jgi:hypothetical protein
MAIDLGTNLCTPTRPSIEVSTRFFAAQQGRRVRLGAQVCL